MGSASLSWLPWTIVLSGLGVFGVWLAIRAGDRSAAIRRAGWALLPWGLWCMGLIRFAVRVTDAIADWAAGFVFSPLSWLGVGMSAAAVLMIGGGAFWSGFRSRRKAKKSGAVEGGAAKQVQAKPSKRKAAPADEDADDIEAILRRHGID